MLTEDGVWGFCVMSDAIIKLGISRPEEETRLTEAIDAFTRWRADAMAQEERDTPGLMVKTGWSADGVIRKTLIFDEPKWADFFLMIWQRDATA